MKILTLDIETSPHEAYAFQVWQANISSGQIIAPTYMLSWSARWLGSKRAPIIRTCYEADHHELLHELLNEADMVVGYNQDKFDLRHINREFVERGMLPTKPVASVDMLKVVKNRFLFPHNRLDYVAKQILGEQKLETGGFDLWPAFMQGDKKAIRLMKKYNQKDVVLTERLYVKLRQWVKNHPNMCDFEIDFGEEPEYSCPTGCGGKVVRKDQRRTRCFAIRQLQCECGHWHEGKRKKL